MNCKPDEYCGTYGRYAHGCREDACGLARLQRQREQRGTQRPYRRASKYETSTPPAVIDRWRELLGGTRGT